jgi:hypothetical protein
MSWDWIIDQYLMEIDEWLAEDWPNPTPRESEKEKLEDVQW